MQWIHYNRSQKVDYFSSTDFLISLKSIFANNFDVYDSHP